MTVHFLDAGTGVPASLSFCEQFQLSGQKPLRALCNVDGIVLTDSSGTMRHQLDDAAEPMKMIADVMQHVGMVDRGLIRLSTAVAWLWHFPPRSRS